jgi:hypothetical protein
MRDDWRVSPPNEHLMQERTLKIPLMMNVMVVSPISPRFDQSTLISLIDLLNNNLDCNRRIECSLDEMVYSAVSSHLGLFSAPGELDQVPTTHDTHKTIELRESIYCKDSISAESY